MKKILLLIFISSFTLFADTPPNLLPEDPTEKTMGDIEFQSSFKKMLLVLTLLVGLIFATVWMIKRLAKMRHQQFNRFSGIKVVEKRNLSAKSILYIVEVGRRRFLVSESHLEVRNLETLPHLTELDPSEINPSKMDPSKMDPPQVDQEPGTGKGG